MLNKFYQPIFIFIALSLFFAPVSAQNGVSQYSYLFFLYLDNSRLVLDKDNGLVFDISEKPYVEPTPKGEMWTGKIFDYDGKELGGFKFYPKTGSNLVKAPHFDKAIRVAFYNPEGHRSLAISVDEGTNFCDFDAICKSDLLENGLTCPNDCPWEMPTTLPSESPLAAQPTGPVPSEFSIVPFLFLIIFLTIGFIVGYIIFRTFKAQ